MSLTATNKGGDFEMTPEGTHIARCYRIIDLGTQFNEQYGKNQQKVMIAWELPAELMEDGRPFSVSKRYTLSLNKKANLRLALEAWRGKVFTDEEAQGFDLKKVLGQPCYLNITHETKGDKTYTNITSILKLPKGVVCPPLVNQAQVLDFDNFDDEVFNSLSDRLKETIQVTPEYKCMVMGRQNGTGQMAEGNTGAKSEPEEDTDPF